MSNRWGYCKLSLGLFLFFSVIFYYIYSRNVIQSDRITSSIPHKGVLNRQIYIGETNKIHKVNNSIHKSFLDKYYAVSYRNKTSLLGDPRAEVTDFTADKLKPGDNENKKILIPHIIHQTWRNYDVPGIFIPWVKSVLKYHRNWEYWFWTDKDTECYMKEKHPEFYQFYMSYPHPLYKADIMRYFLLYDYGGFYLDLDIEVLKSLHPWTYISPSILSHESYEHSYIVHDSRMHQNIINAVMATTKNHSYYKMLQDNIKYYWKIHTNDVLESTGPFFIDEIYRKYRTLPNQDKITVIDPKYWFPTYDPWMEVKVKEWCVNGTLQQNNMIHRICKKQRKEKFTNLPGPDAFLNHHWIHSNLQKPGFQTNNTMSMLKIVPNLVKITDRLDLRC